ncbi:hypothetical protein SAMN04487820_114102 [Actinopolyspora mzabensis]|uniref:Uncharacterized protein n=1 Tax=Actinopolyspora mzabensis TaxID=995066 RepID=A0A1G9FC72_ACTMZ|nr:DUF6461 domain-containing protein [Actinopolyspora mzabensis]SDK85994.1 hypothetical protein SAMN04487820_114102 [Actinopolyspora mzabensis]
MGSGNAEVDRHGWIHDSAVRDAACLTLVRGTDVLRVARAFGADPVRGRPWNFEEFCEESFACADKQSLIGLRRVGGWTLVAEESRFEGLRHDVLAEASSGSELVSVYWDVGDTGGFAHAVDGEVRTCFEPVLPECRSGTRPDDLESLRAGLPWHEAARVPLMLALSARVTGCVPDPEWFAGQFLTCPVVGTGGEVVPGPSPHEIGSLFHGSAGWRV